MTVEEISFLAMTSKRGDLQVRHGLEKHACKNDREKVTGTLGIMAEKNVRVPMRDGIFLSTDVFRPDSKGRFPALVQRTPYGKGSGIKEENFVRAGYAVINQDSRGRYDSEGTFSLFSNKDTLDAEDGYDTVEWAASQPWCSGQVGTFGASYNAWMQYQLAKLRPPHLKAMSAVSIPAELTDVDWPGAFKPGRRIRWWLTTIAPDISRREHLPPPHTPEEANKIWNLIEQGRMLGVVPWSAVTRWLPPLLAEQVEHWLRNPGSHPWKLKEAHKNITVPNLDFTGWFDHCCSIENFTGLQKNARGKKAREQTKIIIGPWNHANMGSREQGDFDFGPNARIDMQQMQIRWFDYWLKGIDNGIDREPAVRYFVMGLNRWKTSPCWPPESVEEKVLYLSSEGSDHLSEKRGMLSSKIKNGILFDTYTYDPLNPVPTLWGPACFYNVSDRRLLDYRNDILRYCTKPLAKDIMVAGNPQVFLYASSSAPDTDFFARLVDENPEGRAMEVCYGMVRARHRKSFDAEDFLIPGRVTEFSIRMGITACSFLKGHRIRLEISSSDFPNYDRNHNTGKNDLFDADMAIAKQKVFHSSSYPSRLILPLAFSEEG